MSKKGKFYGVIKDGKLLLDNRAIFDVWLTTLEGNKIELSIQREKENITQSQWAYLFACVFSPISQETGFSIEETDGVCKKMFLTRNKGTKKEYVKDKSKLSKAELAKFIDDCIHLAAGLGIVVLPARKFPYNSKS